MIIGTHPITGLPLIKEDRLPRRWRALPKALGETAHELERDVNGPWKPGYQEIDAMGLSSVGCMKCGTDIQGFQPKLYRPSAAKPDSQAVHRVRNLPNGQTGIEVAMLPYNHFRVGRYQYRWGDDDILSEFEFLHCADCRISDGDGMELLICCLAGLDDIREWSAKLSNRTSPTDSEHAVRMWRFSQPLELVRIVGLSLSVADLMAGKG